jgi:pyruvate kinase
MTTNTHARKTKIIATVGPASWSYKMLVALHYAGVNAFRLNFSHGTHEEHKVVIDNILKLNKEHRAHVGIIADLQGPKLRVGEIEGGEVELMSGSTIDVYTKERLGNASQISVTYKNLAKDIKPGELILIDDGKIELKALSSNGKDMVTCLVVYGGTLSSRKGFNLPDTRISMSSLTPKDLADLDFILTQPVNWIALSFVRESKVIHELREKIIARESMARIIAKIEKPQAIMNIDAIIKASDAVMVARGDLGVEIPMEEMALVQKDVIKRCIRAAKPVIIATQVMESMLTMPRPSRAEITDVANGVLDGADCIMLSGETSIGLYPVKVVETIDKIIRRTEKESIIYHKGFTPHKDSPTFISDAICYNACKISEEVEASAINGMTYSGYTAFMLASYRPRASIYIFSNNKNLIYTLSILWGVEVYNYDKFNSTDETIIDLIDILKKDNKLEEGNIVINIASMPIQTRGRANMIKITYIR